MLANDLAKDLESQMNSWLLTKWKIAEQICWLPNAEGVLTRFRECWHREFNGIEMEVRMIIENYISSHPEVKGNVEKYICQETFLQIDNEFSGNKMNVISHLFPNHPILVYEAEMVSMEIQQGCFGSYVKSIQLQDDEEPFEEKIRLLAERACSLHFLDRYSNAPLSFQKAHPICPRCGSEAYIERITKSNGQCVTCFSCNDCDWSSHACRVYEDDLILEFAKIYPKEIVKERRHQKALAALEENEKIISGALAQIKKNMKYLNKDDIHGVKKRVNTEVDNIFSQDVEKIR